MIYLSHIYHYTYLLVLVLLLSFGTGCKTTPAKIVSVTDLHHTLNTLGIPRTKNIIIVSTADQTLTLLRQNKIETIYTISTSKRGVGQRVDTFKTPLGLHRVNEKIGDDVPPYGIFVKREYVGAAWSPLPGYKHKTDFVSTRILRLEGLELGINRGFDKRGRVVDSDERAIYIHGTTKEWLLGKPSTKGCVHMAARDIVSLFPRVPVGTLVWITPHQFQLHSPQ